MSDVPERDLRMKGCTGSHPFGVPSQAYAPRAGAPQDFAQFEHQQRGTAPEHQPGGIWTKRDRCGPKQRLSGLAGDGWPVAGRSWRAQSRHSCRFEKRPTCQTVRVSLRAPKARSNSAITSTEKAASRAWARLLIDIPLIREGAQGDPSSEAADQGNALAQSASRPVAPPGGRGGRVSTPGSIGSVASAKAGSPSVTRLIHSN